MFTYADMSNQPKICAFDIETRGTNPEFISGAVVSDDVSEHFEHPAQMIECLRRHARKGYTLIAHNAEYDVAILLWGQGEDVKIEYVNGLYASGYWRYSTGKRVCPIWDSMRLCAGLELSQLGDAISLPKYPQPKKLIDPDDIRQDWVCEEHGWPGCIQCYNQRDTEIVWGYINMLREWCNGYGVTIRRSVPRLAMDLWSIFDPGQQQQLRSKTMRDFARAAYFGGRNELFHYGACTCINTFDVRTYYGSILLSISLPDMSTLEYVDNAKVNDVPDNAEGVIEATVTIREQYCPPLPVRYSGRIYFPVGQVRGVWSLSELRSSMVYGVEVVKVHRLATTRTLRQPFATTAAILIELRDEWLRKGDPRAVIPKFLLNAIPGRLGMRDAAERRIYRRWRRGMGQTELHGAEIETAGDAMFLVKSNSLMKPSNHANVLWAAIINSVGRQRLYPHLLAAGPSLAYCDTDSVHSFARIPTGPDMAGQLRDTGYYDNGLYLAPKFYRLEAYDGTGEVRAKGVPRRYADAFISTGGAAFQTSLGVIESIRRDINPHTWITAERELSYAPVSRTILSPDAIGKHDRSSSTAPLAFTLSGDGGNVPI